MMSSLLFWVIKGNEEYDHFVGQDSQVLKSTGSGEASNINK